MKRGQPTIEASCGFEFWDGTMQQLDNQGRIGILINVTILVAVLVLKAPGLEI